MTLSQLCGIGIVLFNFYIYFTTTKDYKVPRDLRKITKNIIGGKKVQVAEEAELDAVTVCSDPDTDVDGMLYCQISLKSQK